MPPKKDPSVLEELIRALQDNAVLAAIGAIFDKRLSTMSTEIAELKTDNLGLRRNLIAANQCIEALEAYSKRHDIIITGIPVSTFAEAASNSITTGASSFEHAASTEAAVLELFNDDLKVAVIRLCRKTYHQLIGSLRRRKLTGKQLQHRSSFASQT